MCVAVFYGWAVTCKERFRAHPTQVVHECICGDQAQGNASACRAKARTTFSRPSIVACADAASALSRRRVCELVHERRTAAVQPDDSAARAATVMTTERLDALPVTDRRGRLVGLLTARDYVASVARTHRHAGPADQGPARSTLSGLAPRHTVRDHRIAVP